MGRKQKGFSLIELLIVVMIILIIAAIAVPNLVRSRMAAWKEVRAGEQRDLCELLQHEIDHLDGILAIDRISDMRTICTREEFEKRYRAQSPYATQDRAAS